MNFQLCRLLLHFVAALCCSLVQHQFRSWYHHHKHNDEDEDEEEDDEDDVDDEDHNEDN